MPKKQPNTEKDTHIHDAVFKRIYKTPKFTVELFKVILPTKVFALFHWETLEIEESTATASSNKEIRADLVLTVKLKHEKASNKHITISIILEHKGFRDHDAILQIMDYYVNTCRRTRGVVIPIVLLCCKDKNFKIKDNYLSWVFKKEKIPTALHKLSPWLPNFFCKIINLHEIPLDHIWQQAASTGIILYGMRRFWEAGDDDLAVIIEKSRLISRENAGIVMNVLTDYYKYADKGLDVKEFNRVERERWPQLQEEERIMPTFEFTIDKVNAKIDAAKKAAVREGRQEGKREGRQEAKLEIASRLLKSSIDIDDTTICKIAQLTKEDLLQLKRKLAGKQS